MSVQAQQALWGTRLCSRAVDQLGRGLRAIVRTRPGRREGVIPLPSIGTPLKDLLARQTRKESPIQTGDYTLVGMTDTLGQLGTCQICAATIGTSHASTAV